MTYEGLSDNAQELVLYAENTEPLYAAFMAIIAEMSRRIERGTYDPEKAPKRWRYWTDDAARRYRREIAPRAFAPADRQQAAEYFAATEADAIRNGEYADVEP